MNDQINRPEIAAAIFNSDFVLNASTCVLTFCNTFKMFYRFGLLMKPIYMVQFALKLLLQLGIHDVIDDFYFQKELNNP